VLVFILVQGDADNVDIAVIRIMVYLTFPIGEVVVACVDRLIRFAAEYGIDAPSGLLTNVALWLCFMAAGYFQWFVLVPRVFRGFRAFF
jgi:hypothetical protein